MASWGMVPILMNLLVQLPPDLDRDEQEALLASCSRALHPQVCLASTDGENAPAKIERLAPERFVVELNVETATRERLISREFNFKPADEPLERARALGLSLGLLARTSTAEERKETTVLPPPAPAPTVVEAPSTDSRVAEKGASARERSRTIFAELAVGAGYEARLRAALPLAEIKLRLAPTKPMSFTASFAARGTRTRIGRSRIEVLSLTPMLGLRYTLNGRLVSLGLELEGGAEAISVESIGSRSSGSRWAPVFRLALPCLFHLGDRLYVLAAVRAEATPSVTEVYVDGTRLVTTAPVLASLSAGVGYAF